MYRLPEIFTGGNICCSKFEIAKLIKNSNEKNIE
jgi:hypothetical protein